MDAGVKIGLEVHQQLDTKKLFCDCPSSMEEKTLLFEVRRKLRPVVGELGEVDRAAIFEFFRDRTFVYRVYEGEACLVELDEEPPHLPNPEALELAIQAALLFDLKIPSEIHVMRKLVLDGSAVTSFQRTMLVGYGRSEIEDGVFITELYLEEDAAKKEKEEGNVVYYSLSRLGIPLLEVDTTPTISSPEQAKSIAKAIGLTLRSLKVKRGIGTIRQDVNISIPGGARVEIKGWQDLRRLDKLVENEIRRQKTLLLLKDEIGRVRSVLRREGDKWYVEANIARFLELELCKGKHLSEELEDYVKVYGCSFEVKRREERAIFEISGRNAMEAARTLKSRIDFLPLGIPPETRSPNPDATTSFSRPLPGSARMYPETDVPPIYIASEFLSRLKKSLPKNLYELKLELESELPTELVEQITSSKRFKLFLNLRQRFPGLSKEVAITLTKTVKELERAGYDVERIDEKTLIEIFAALEERKIVKRAVEKILEEVLKGKDVKEALASYRRLTGDELRKAIKRLIQGKEGLDERKLLAFLLGELKYRATPEDVEKELTHCLEDTTLS